MIKKMEENGRIGQAIFRSVFSFAFIILLMLAAHNAYSAQARVYLGDGAVINPSVPPGGWLYGDGWFSCLGCHNPSANAIFRGPDMTSYLKTGHKNILRRAQVDPVALTGPDGNAYTADGSGNVFNWTNNTIDILGKCSNSSTDSQSVCTGEGEWLSGSKYLYYILGGWMVGPAVPMALYDGSYTQGTQKTAVSYSCARCHTTGYTMDASVQTSNRNPEAMFQGISWTPSHTTGIVDFDPDGNGPAIAGSWVMDGIQCERCHDATDHVETGKGTLVRGVNATALCMQCHRQEHTLPYTGGGLGSNIVPTPYTDNGPLPASEPLYTLPAIEVGGYGGYAKQFYGYSTGMEFLNGAHGKYTGNFQQIGDTSYYGSAFINEDPSGGGCTTCHNVHQSTVAAVNASQPFKKTCPDCHVSLAANILNSIRHPATSGTPFGDNQDVPGACIICHMPRPNDGIGASAHIFRVNVNENYNTFPSQTEWDAGQRTANTSADGSYTEAVWLDVDMVCGQCHGPAGPAVHQFSKTALSTFAEGMHAGGEAPTTDCAACHATSQNGLAPVNPGTDHHTGTCTTCHTEPGVTQLTTANASCATCHATSQNGLAPVNPGTDHHAGTCITCHTEPGVAQLTTANVSCATCHTIGANATHHVSTANGCTTCHTEPGVTVPASTNANCLACHSSSQGSFAAINTTNHHGSTQNCTICHTGEPFTPLPATTNASCAKCHNKNIAMMNHPVSTGTPATCITCHTKPGTPISIDASCGSCHGGSASPSATKNGAPYISKVSLDVFAKNMHINAAPKASFTSSMSLYTVTLTDTSTDDSIFPDNAITVKWGDGTSSTGNAGSVFSHTYATPDKFYIVYTVTDSDRLRNSKAITVAVKFSITANISPALQSDAKFILKKNGVTKATGTGTASFVFSNLKPGAYQVKMSKSGYIFDGDDITAGSQNPVTVTVGPKQTVTFTHTP
ncbi:MAG: hypothetical protein HZB30_03225 [Nitrospirae bacterium]|nr:hypothetical protein [Nitrospirota bacterium]